MYAIFETGGKQYRVAPGEILTVERLKGNVGETVKFDKVLLVGGNEVLVGAPYVSQATLEGEIVEQSRGDKLFIVKYRRRKGYRRMMGHRQEQTLLLITAIQNGKGNTEKYDAAQRNAILAKASIATSTKEKKVAKKAPAKTVKAAAATAEKPAKKAAAKTTAAKKTTKAKA